MGVKVYTHQKQTMCLEVLENSSQSNGADHLVLIIVCGEMGNK